MKYCVRKYKGFLLINISIIDTYISGQNGKSPSSLFAAFFFSVLGCTHVWRVVARIVRNTGGTPFTNYMYKMISRRRLMWCRYSHITTAVIESYQRQSHRCSNSPLRLTSSPISHHKNVAACYPAGDLVQQGRYTYYKDTRGIFLATKI